MDDCFVLSMLTGLVLFLFVCLPILLVGFISTVIVLTMFGGWVFLCFFLLWALPFWVMFFPGGRCLSGLLLLLLILLVLFPILVVLLLFWFEVALPLVVLPWAVFICFIFSFLL